MKTRFFKTLTASALLLFIFAISGQAQQDAAVLTAKQAKDWFKQKDWLGGVQLKPSKSIDPVEFYRQYQGNKKYWDDAFSFIKSHDLKTLAPGKYPIDGDHVFASVSVGPSKSFDDSQWESHRKYCDLQYVIDGEEKIGQTPVAGLTDITVPYDASKDIAHYNGPGKYYLATPKVFFVFPPKYAHRPNILVKGYPTVKKLVIKVEAVQ